MRTRALLLTIVCSSFGCASGSLDGGAPGAAGGPPEQGAKNEMKTATTEVVAEGVNALTAFAPAPDATFAQLRFDPANPFLNPWLPADEWACALGGVTGSMQDGDARVYIVNGHWAVLGRGSPGHTAPTVTANCVPIAGFSGPIPEGATDTTRWLSGEFSFSVARDHCDFVIQGHAWWGNAATFLQSFQGGMYGGGESVSIFQSNDPRTPSGFAANVCQGSLSMVVRSLFVGIPAASSPTPQDRQAKFRGPWGVGSADTAGEYEARQSFVTMARTDEAFCYFTDIQGGFAGGAETAEIVTATDTDGAQVWALRSRSGQEDPIVAKARCYMFDQN
jgi:hypothetical protein